MDIEIVNCKTCGNPFERSRKGFLRKYCDTCKGITAKVETKAEITPPAPEPAPTPTPVAASDLSQNQLQALLQAMSQQNIEAIAAFAAELRKPDPETVAKKEAEKERMERLRQSRLKAARKTIEAQERTYAACAAVGHKDQKGRYVIGGQICSGDGKYHGFCLRCGYEFPPVDPRGDMMTGTTALTNFSFGGGDNMTLQ